VLLGAIGVSGSFNPSDDVACASVGAATVYSGGSASALVIPTSSGSSDGVSLAVAASRAEAVISASTSAGTLQTVCVVDAFANTKLLMRMDGSLLLSVDYACRKARSSALFGMRSESLYPLVIPSGQFWTAAASNGQLAPYAGAIPLQLADSTPAGAIGCSGSYNASVDAQQCDAGAGTSVAGAVLSLPLGGALAVVQAALTAAQQLPGPPGVTGAWVTVVVLDAGGRMVAAASTDGTPPGSVDTATKRARAAAYLHVENSVVLPGVQPGAPAYGAQFVAGAVIHS
jgi:uncharacterized protein GlcG (DUF336 family)